MDPRYPPKIRALCLALAKLPMDNACELAEALKENKEVLDCLAHFLLKKLPLLHGEGRYRIITGVSGDDEWRRVMGITDEPCRTAKFTRDTPYANPNFHCPTCIGGSELEAMVVLVQREIRWSRLI